MRPVIGLLVTALVAAAGPALAQETDVGLRPTVAPDAVAADEAVGRAIRMTSEPGVDAPFRRTEEGDPYAALGIRAGGMILYPALTGTIGYTTNANGIAGASGSGYGTLTPELRLESDWARHAVSLNARGSYQKYFSGADDKPEASIDGTARIDFADGWQGDVGAGYRYSQQAISDPDFPAGADGPPGVHAFNGSAAITGHAGPAKLTVGGAIERTVYEDATFGGVPVDQGDRNNTVYTARIRAGYEVTPSLMPFVEGDVARRAYDRQTDGVERSGYQVGWRVGIAVDRAPVLSGEIAVGSTRATFDNPALDSLSALTVDGSLVWSPTALTTVTLAGSTALRPTATIGSSGSVVYDGSLDVAYAYRRNFTLNWNTGVSHERFQGSNDETTTYRAGLGATWKVNRAMWLTAGYVHEWVEDPAPGASYQSDAVRMELRLQR